MAKKVSVMDILEKENETLDCLLDCQSNVHIAVKTRNWIGLEEYLEKGEAAKGYTETEKRLYAIRDYMPDIEYIYVCIKR